MPTVEFTNKWEIDYSKDAPCKNVCKTDFSRGFISDKASGYWEDGREEFKSAPFFEDIVINPEYEELSYPMTTKVPDMVLKTFVGTFWYRTSVFVNGEKGKNRVLFSSAPVHNRALVFINGVFAGEHFGYSTPFTLDVTDFVNFGRENVLTLAVSNHQAYNENGDMISGCTSRAANRFTGGITGDITLEVKESSYISDVHVSFYDEKNDEFTVHFETFGEDFTRMDFEILDGERVLKAFSTNDTKICIKRDGLELWSVDNPKLYTLKCFLASGGNALDEKEIKFGLRSVSCDGYKIKLNSQALFLRGICEHGYFPLTVHPAHDIEYYLNVITKIKELGFNFIRFHTWIPTEEYMTSADRLGIVLHVESPNNTTLCEWKEIMKIVRRHPSVIIACCGNEMLIDDEFVTRLEKCAEITHALAPSILFSPMSALRGVEYCWNDTDYGQPVVETPFKHNPERLQRLQNCSDIFSSFVHGLLSYKSTEADPDKIDSWASLLGLPRVTHEICIHGTYIDLSLEKRYENTRIGETQLYSSVREMLEREDLISRAPLFYKNSCRWQQLVRKQCFESARLCKTLAGFDFLGDIDHHWHTFGYRCGMMNEFYELKPGESVENVHRYNGDNVILTDLGTNFVFWEEEEINFDFFVSLYGKTPLENAKLSAQLKTFDGDGVGEYSYNVSAPAGEVSKVANFKMTAPKTDKAVCVRLLAKVLSDTCSFENEWDLWILPKLDVVSDDIVCVDALTDDVIKKLENGAKVLMLGTKGMYSNPMSFRIALSGRVDGNLATVIEDHPLTRTFEHEGFCSWLFSDLMNDSECLYFAPDVNVPFLPVVEVVSSYKWVRREAAVVEFCVGRGKLLVSTFNYTSKAPSVVWWKNHLLQYMKGEKFAPKNKITVEQLKTLFPKTDFVRAEKNDNFAGNANDKTMKR